MAVYTTFTSKAQYYSGNVGSCVGGGEDYRTLDKKSTIENVNLLVDPKFQGLSSACTVTRIEASYKYRVTNTSNGSGLSLKAGFYFEGIYVNNPQYSGTSITMSGNYPVNGHAFTNLATVDGSREGNTSYASINIPMDLSATPWGILGVPVFIGGRFVFKSLNDYVGCRVWLKDVTFSITRTRGCYVYFDTGIDGTGTVQIKCDYGTVPSYSGSLSKTGYTFKGWKAVNGTIYAGALPTAGETDVTYTAVWERIAVYVTYDSIFSFKRWAETNLATWDLMRISNVTDAGFTGTALVEDAYTTECRPLISVEAGKTYTFECDVSGGGFEFFIFNCNSAGAWADFTYGNTKKFDFIPSTNYISIRCDVVGTGTVTNFSNFRIYPSDRPYMSASVSATERTDLNNWSMPTPAREGYNFKGWNTKPDGTGVTYTSGSAYPTGDLVLYSQWEVAKINKIIADLLKSKKLIIDFDEIKAIKVDTTKVYG